MRRECRQRFPAADYKGNRYLTIPAYAYENQQVHIDTSWLSFKAVAIDNLMFKSAPESVLV